VHDQQSFVNGLHSWDYIDGVSDYCGYSCKVNSFVCAGLPHNHWQKSYIARGEIFKMTCDDVDKIEVYKNTSRSTKLGHGSISYHVHFRIALFKLPAKCLTSLSDVTLGPCISFIPRKALLSPSVVI
jgi:hypothetical protein